MVISKPRCRSDGGIGIRLTQTRAKSVAESYISVARVAEPSHSNYSLIVVSHMDSYNSCNIKQLMDMSGIFAFPTDPSNYTYRTNKDQQYNQLHYQLFSASTLKIQYKKVKLEELGIRTRNDSHVHNQSLRTLMNNCCGIDSKFYSTCHWSRISCNFHNQRHNI